MGPDGQGDDAGPGTYAQPFATLQHALIAAVSNDTILLKNGTHTQSNTVLVTLPVHLKGEDRYATTVYFPSNFTASQNIHAFSLNADGISMADLTVERDNFLAFGAVIEITGVDFYWPTVRHYDSITLENLDLVGGTRTVLMNPGNFTMRNCLIRDMDAASDSAYGQDALAFEITGFTGTVDIANVHIEGALLGYLGGTRVRRAFQIEARIGTELCAGVLRLASNTIHDVREPFLWDCYENPITNKAAVAFVHNTIHVTEKTPFTLFAYGSGTEGHEYQKFESLLVRDNIFADLGGSSVVRSDYQYANFARNFPMGGFTFDHNLLFVDDARNIADALGAPLAQDPGWFGGSEFDVAGQDAGLRISYTNAPPFLDPAHGNGNFALNGATDAGRAALGGASDGGNLGAWPTPKAEVLGVPGTPFTVSWTTVSNMTYLVESSTGGLWTTVGTPVQATGDYFSAADTNTTGDHRWFRVKATE
ncbi:MAG: hypothetical protein V1929_01150 [bacterium]